MQATGFTPSKRIICAALTLALVGCPDVAQLDPSYLNIPKDWATGKHNL